MAVIANLIGREICDALGLPPGVRTLELRFAPDELVTATVEYYPEGDEVDNAARVLKRYELHEKIDAPANG